MTVTVGNQFGVRQKDGAVLQYIPPSVKALTTGSVSYSDEQNLTAGAVLEAGTIYLVVSGTLQVPPSETAVVKEVTIA